MSIKFNSKIVQINDIIEWYEKGELDYSPKYQRNSVWTQNAKSYLIDTIIRGLPIPPIFLRQKIDVGLRKTTREVIDGQQRLRAIIDYVYEENFAVMSKHNNEFGNKKYSELDDDKKADILSYEIISQVVTEDDDSLIYDMFARLNSNNVALNKQEIRNSVYWGDFKVFIYQITSDYRKFFSEYNFFTDKDFSRMNDYEFMNSLIILIKDGIINETPKIIDKYYSDFNEFFDSADDCRKIFNDTIQKITEIFNRVTEIKLFNSKNYFYSLFSILLCVQYGNEWKGFEDLKFSTLPENFEDRIASTINNILESRKKDSILPESQIEQYQLLDSLHKRRTTNRSERIERIKLLAELLGVK